jgi:hypothetical protein
VRFYEVELVPAGEMVALTAVADDHYFGAWYRGAEAAFRTHASAEKDCARRNAEEEDERDLVPDDPLDGGPFDPFRSRPRRSRCCDFEPRPRLRAEPNGMPYYEPYDLEVVGRPRGSVYVVVRTVLLHGRLAYTRIPMEGGPSFIFVRGFVSKADAEKYRKGQEAEAWRLAFPGQLPCAVPESFPEAVRKLGLPPPAFEELPADTDDDDELQYVLLDWWESLGERATPEIQARVWKLLDWHGHGEFVGFFDVLTVPLGD